MIFYNVIIVYNYSCMKRSSQHMREVVMNDKSNLLQLEEHFYQLVDVDEPNTFRNLFSL